MAAPKPIWVHQAEEAKLKSEAETAAAAKAAFDATFKALSASAADQDQDHDDDHHPHKPSSPAQADRDADSDDDDRHHAPPGPVDPSKSSAAGPGIAGGSAGAPATFTVVAKDRDSRRVLTGGARVRVRISPAAGVGGDDLDGAVKDNGDGSYAVTYVVPKRGNYMVHVDLDGSPVMGSPFPVFFIASTSTTTTSPTTLPAVTSTYPNMVEEGDDSDEEENHDDADDDDNDDSEMGELEKEYRTLQANHQNILMTLKQHRDDDAMRGQAVKNQKALWDKTLETRFLLQKAFSTSNRLPKEPIKSRFCDQDKEIEKAYADLLDSSKQTLGCMLDLQEALLERNQAAKGANELSSDPNGENDEWSEVQELQRRITPFRNSEIDKWQRKTQVTTGAAALKGKLHAFNQSISDQVTGYMRDPSRMINRMYLRKSNVGVLGEDVGEPGTTKEEHNLEGDPELIDDSEFYQHLLKEFLESCDTGASESAFYALRKQQHKKRKLVDRRASKSRKIRYHVHEKIANFMAPVPMVLPPMAPKLFENLFGMGNQKPTTV